MTKTHSLLPSNIPVMSQLGRKYSYCMILESGACFNPLIMHGFSHHYQLDEFTFILRGTRSDFNFLFHILTNSFLANRIAQDGMPHFAASHLGLYFLPMSHKKDATLI